MSEDSQLKLVKKYLLQLQNKVCNMVLDQESSATFYRDEWKRSEGGGGITCILENGKEIERAGVNFSHIWGESLPAAATAKRPELSGHSFHATGVSVIIHPMNPYAPTTHFNVRYFSANDPKEDKTIWWFGGGFDLTPYYGFEEDAIHWHQSAKEACEPFGDTLYKELKKWCDDYFYIKHRQEQRGVGGIFFDDHNTGNFEKDFAFMQNVGKGFINGYMPIIEKRKTLPYGERERRFQCYRRSRYVEFNLIYDRGTLFGLQSGGRPDSILSSMPPQVSWQYQWPLEPGSEEEKLYNYYLKPKDWI